MPRSSLLPRVSLVSTIPEWLVKPRDKSGRTSGCPVSFPASNTMRAKVSDQETGRRGEKSNVGLLDSWVVGLPAVAAGTSGGRWRYEVEGRGMKPHWPGDPIKKKFLGFNLVGLRFGRSTPSATAAD